MRSWYTAAMLQFNNLALRRGPRLLFENATLTIHRGQKVGITGTNGTGKSSLFALIRGKLHADAGDISLPPNVVIAHMAQEIEAVDLPALTYVMAGDAELTTLQQEIAQAETQHDGVHLATLYTRLDNIGGYTARSRAAKLMSGLGFSPSQEQARVKTFSGGWRMRLNLARTLMCRSDLLLLDEPTNHLDLDAILWLQEWLKTYPGTLLLVSHDRDFLDEVSDHIVNIEHETVTLYTGNYSAFEVMRAEQLAGQQSAREKQQREVAKMRAYVERFGAKASKARQAQSRLKALGRMELIAAAHVDSPFTFIFRNPPKIPNPLLRLEAAQVRYGERTILAGTSLSLTPGDRIGLLGVNGAGKSTFIKLLAGALAPSAGQRIEAQDLRIGYFAQHQLEQLRASDSPLNHLQRLDRKATEKELRNFLGGFGFQGDAALAPVAPLSGGEKARLVLAMLVYQRPSLLLLDEPTNHLDLEMRQALIQSLQDFDGAMVVVSHDRHMLRSVTDTLLLVADGAVNPFDGDLEDYRKWLSARAKDQGKQVTTITSGNSAAQRKDQRRQEANQRQQVQPLRKKLAQLEGLIEQLKADKARLTLELAVPALYEEAGKAKLQTLQREQARASSALNEAEEAWLTASEQLEALAKDQQRQASQA